MNICQKNLKEIFSTVVEELSETSKKLEMEKYEFRCHINKIINMHLNNKPIATLDNNSIMIYCNDSSLDFRKSTIDKEITLWHKGLCYKVGKIIIEYKLKKTKNSNCYNLVDIKIIEPTEEEAIKIYNTKLEDLGKNEILAKKQKTKKEFESMKKNEKIEKFDKTIKLIIEKITRGENVENERHIVNDYLRGYNRVLNVYLEYLCNKELIENKINSLGYKLGCYDKAIDNLQKRCINLLLENIDGDSTDVDIVNNGTEYIIEINVVDNEIDLSMITKKDYIARYGNSRYEE